MQFRIAKYRSIAIGIYLSLSGIAFTQNSKENKIVDYIDRDNKKDEVTLKRSSGNSDEYFELQFRFSDSGKKITTKGHYNFSSFICMIPLPDEVSEKNVSFLKKLAKELMGLAFQDSAGSELQWFDEILENKTKTNDSSLVDFKSFFKPVWTSSFPDYKQRFATLISSKMAARMASCFLKDNDISYEKYLTGYFGNNQGKSVCKSEISNNHATLCTTNHGVFLKRGTSYSWVFINDLSLFGFGSEKLRWPSLRSADLYNDSLIAINIYSATSEQNALYFVNINSCQLLRLNNDFLGIDIIDSVKIVGDKVQLISKAREITLLLKDIFSL